MYRFVFSPRWVAGHLLVVLAIVVMVNLGFWQLRRLDERRVANASIERNASLPTTSAGEVGNAADDEFRRLQATGRFDGADVVLGYRSLNGISGHHVLTPFVLDDGRIVLVNRGWVPAQYLEEWPVADAAPPAGRTTVTGFVRRSEPDGGVREGGSDRRRPLVVRRVDVDRISARLDLDAGVLPFWIQLSSPTPADGIPAPVPLPDLGQGSHLSYAVQWFIFSAGAAVGWVILVRLSAGRRALARAAAGRENDAAAVRV